MSSRTLLLGAAVVLSCACSSPQRPPPPQETTTTKGSRISESTKVTAFALSNENLNVDKVGMQDGLFRPDGNRDHAFDATVEGPFDALFIVSCDAKGVPVYGFRADTLIGNEEVPAALGSVIDTGKMTLPIGVVENGKFANSDSGSVIVSGGTHRLKLYVPNSAALRPGMHVRLYARSMGAIAPGPFFEY
jgi:hypothetical protein